MTLIRKAISDLNNLRRLQTINLVDDIVNYFNRQTDRTAIKNKVKDRYATGIRKVDDGVADGGSMETYAREGFSELVDCGITPTVSSGFGFKVVNALATMFTERGQKYSLAHESVDDLEEVEKLLLGHRHSGQYNQATVDADKLAVQVGSSAVFVSWSRGHVRYQHFSPADIAIFYSDDGLIEDEGEQRLIDQRDIEDASAVRIRLSKVDELTWNYLLIMGASDLYPQGRYVYYQADSTGGEIPNVGDMGAFDFEIGGRPGNPLSFFANENPDLDLPEYPIAIIKSGLTESDDAMPVSSSLYNDCLEMDVATSHLQHTSQAAATGTIKVTRDAQGNSTSLPRTMAGIVALPMGMNMERIPHDEKASVDAMANLVDTEIRLAAGYSIPAYVVAPDKVDFGQQASGVSLEIQTMTMKRVRENRIELVRPAVEKIFTIEKALIDLFAEGNDSEVKLLQECEQVWDAGEFKLPENKKESAERIISLMDKGVLDTIAALREYYQFTSDEEAIEMYEKMKEREKEYPPLKNGQEEEKPPLGLQGRVKPGVKPGV
jgi:hypothetical protein